MDEQTQNVRQTRLRRWEVCWGCEHHANYDIIEAPDRDKARALALEKFQDVHQVRLVAEPDAAQRSEAEEPSAAVRCSELLVELEAALTLLCSAREKLKQEEDSSDYHRLCGQIDRLTALVSRRGHSSNEKLTDAAPNNLKL